MWRDINYSSLLFIVIITLSIRWLFLHDDDDGGNDDDND